MMVKNNNLIENTARPCADIFTNITENPHFSSGELQQKAATTLNTEDKNNSLCSDAVLKNNFQPLLNSSDLLPDLFCAVHPIEAPGADLKKALWSDDALFPEAVWSGSTSESGLASGGHLAGGSVQLEEGKIPSSVLQSFVSPSPNFAGGPSVVTAKNNLFMGVLNGPSAQRPSFVDLVSQEPTKAAAALIAEKILKYTPAEVHKPPDLPLSETPDAAQHSFADAVKGQSLDSPIGQTDFSGDIPTAVFTDKDCAQVSAVFKNALIGKFSYGKPDTNVISKHLQNSGFGFCKVQILNFKHVLITLQNEAFYSKLWLKREFNILGAPMRLFKWDPLFNFKQEPASAPVWIRIHDLLIQWFDIRALQTVGSLVGPFIKADSNTINRNRLNYARICVELNLKNVINNSVGIQFNGVRTELAVEYEKMPSYCHHCNHIGHDIDACYIKNPDLRPTNFVNKFQKTSTDKGKEKVNEWTTVSKNGKATTSKTRVEGNTITSNEPKEIVIVDHSEDTNMSIDIRKAWSIVPTGDEQRKDGEEEQEKGLETRSMFSLLDDCGEAEPLPTP
ncbi:hypothetical protein OROGR_004728 [Orobanche gracilis]